MQSSRDLLEAEAKNFFAAAGEQEREEARAFQSASVSTLARDEEADRENQGT